MSHEVLWEHGESSGISSENFFEEFAKSTKVKKSFVKLGGLCERSYPDSAVAGTC